MSHETDHLQPETWAYVGSGNLRHNMLRSEPIISQPWKRNITGIVPLGSSVWIYPSPSADAYPKDDGQYRWWYVGLNGGQIRGWTTETGPDENGNKVRYLEPYGPDLKPPSTCRGRERRIAPESHIIPGHPTIVTTGKLNLRMNPGKNGKFIKELREGDTLNVIRSHCVQSYDPMIWWQVYIVDDALTAPSKTNENIGWVSEAQNRKGLEPEYFLESNYQSR